MGDLHACKLYTFLTGVARYTRGLRAALRAKPRLAAARDDAARGPAAAAHLQVLHGDLHVRQVEVGDAAAAVPPGGAVAEGEDVGEGLAAQPLLRGERGQRAPVAAVQHEARHARRLLRRRDGLAGCRQQQQRRRAQERKRSHPAPTSGRHQLRAPQAPSHTAPVTRGEGRGATVPHPPLPTNRRRQLYEWEIRVSALNQWADDARSFQPMSSAGRRGQALRFEPVVNISDSSARHRDGRERGGSLRPSSQWNASS